MKKCWKLDPQQRPTFSELLATLDKTLTTVAGYMELGMTLEQPEMEEKECVKLESASATNIHPSGMLLLWSASSELTALTYVIIHMHSCIYVCHIISFFLFFFYPMRMGKGVK